MSSVSGKLNGGHISYEIELNQSTQHIVGSVNGSRQEVVFMLYACVLQSDVFAIYLFQPTNARGIYISHRTQCCKLIFV